MKISIVVPAYNEEKLLGATLDCIGSATLSLPQCEWELIVCDNNSTDRTAGIAREHGARVVFEPVNQISRARNAGAAAATGHWLVFVDADSRPSSRLLSAVLAEISSGSCLAGGSTVALDDEGLHVRMAIAMWNSLSRAMRWAAGSFIFCETRAFRAVGGFSVDLYAAEEIELSSKLKHLAQREGRRIAILHRHPLHTSGRKARLYTPWEMTRFMLRTLVTGGRNLRKRSECYAWYDGRR